MPAITKISISRLGCASGWTSRPNEGRSSTTERVLLLDSPVGTETIRVYDGAHGYNEMHRYTRLLGKQTGTPFHSGSLGEGMRAAIQDMEAGYLKMVEGWER